MFILKRIEKKIDSLTKDTSKERSEDIFTFDSELKRLCELRVNIKTSKSLIKLTSLIKKEPLIKNKRIAKGIKGKNEKEKYYSLRSRALQKVDSMIAARVVDLYITR